MALKLFEFLEQGMTGIFSTKLTQFQKTESIGIISISLSI